MIQETLENVYAFGCESDASATSREQMMFNITPATGELLKLLVEEAKPRCILEIGTSNGYSTIWLAWAAQIVAAEFHSVDISAKKTAMADVNLRDAGLRSAVTLHTADAGEYVAELPAESVDFLFLDSQRSAYLGWWPGIANAMRWGMIVADNATSHPGEMQPLFDAVRSDALLTSLVLPVGKGQLVVQHTSSTGSGLAPELA